MSLTTISTASGRVRLATASGMMATLAVGIYLAMFQSGLMSYIGSDLQGAKWPTFLALAVYGGSMFAAGAGVYLGRLPRNVTLCIGLFLLIALLPFALTQAAVGPVAKSYVVGMCSLTLICIASCCADARRLAQFAASVTCVASLACLLDLCFFDGFSNTAGRAAALYVNPNVAALALLLGAVGSIWAVSYRWRPAYLVLVAGAVVATLSRSAMLLAAFVLIASIPAFEPDWRAKARQMQAGMKHAAWVFALVVALFATAAFNNKGFLVAVRSGAIGAETALRWFEAAKSPHLAARQAGVAPAAASAVVVATAPAVAASATPKVAATPAPASLPAPQRKAIPAKQPVAATKTITQHKGTQKPKSAVPSAPTVADPATPCAKTATSAIAETEEMNSAAARGLLAQRAWQQFRTGPATGVGLERAFALGPHNSLLLFADAFGYYGWLIVPALIALILVVGGWRRALPAATLVAGASLVSHDLLLAMPLVAGLASIIAGLAATRLGSPRVVGTAVPHVVFSFVAVAIATICVAACIGRMHRLGPYETYFSAAQINAHGGDAFYVVLPPAFPPGLVRYGAEGVAGLTGTVLTESGRTLSPTRRSIDEIGLGVRGRYGFENSWLYFSSSDGSRPGANGMRYHLVAPIVIHPLFVLCTLLTIVWAVCWLMSARVRLLKAPSFAKWLPFGFSGQ